MYVSSQELYHYFKRFSAKHGLDRFIHLESEVTGASWTGSSWQVDVHDRLNDRTYQSDCDILINATGILNNWTWPAIDGLEKFRGSLLHSANWDSAISLENKDVGLIGNG